jgi:predicted acetyltransferase
MELIIPNKRYFQSYLEAINEYKENNVITYDFLDASKFNIFEYMDNFRKGINLPKNYVRATYLWLVDEDEFIGEVSIRHSLTDQLLRFGGNIGYGIRFSKWNQGLGTLMLALALKYGKDVIGLKKVLITCNDDNKASSRVIEKNGGLLRDKIMNNIDGIERLTRRYWIEIS